MRQKTPINEKGAEWRPIIDIINGARRPMPLVDKAIIPRGDKYHQRPQEGATDKPDKLIDLKFLPFFW